MYFTLEINEQLANAMRAAAEFKVEVEKIIEGVCDSADRREYEQMSDDICTMIVSDAMSIVLTMHEVHANTDRERKSLINTLSVLSDYNDLLTALSKEK